MIIYEGRLMLIFLMITALFISCYHSKNVSENKLSKSGKEQGYSLLFDRNSLNHWTGNRTSYMVEKGNIVFHPERGSRGNLYTKRNTVILIFVLNFS